MNYLLPTAYPPLRHQPVVTNPLLRNSILQLLNSATEAHGRKSESVVYQTRDTKIGSLCGLLLLISFYRLWWSFAMGGYFLYTTLTRIKSFPVMPVAMPEWNCNHESEIFMSIDWRRRYFFIGFVVDSTLAQFSSPSSEIRRQAKNHHQ